MIALSLPILILSFLGGAVGTAIIGLIVIVVVGRVLERGLR